jgi:hypothetical protein
MVCTETRIAPLQIRQQGVTEATTYARGFIILWTSHGQIHVPTVDIQ